LAVLGLFCFGAAVLKTRFSSTLFLIFIGLLSYCGLLSAPHAF
jgi:hypothetical protein